jgi:hypothetical protein
MDAVPVLLADPEVRGYLEQLGRLGWLPSKG